MELASDERGTFQDYAVVVFKHPISVEDGIQLMNGTKLYGMPVVTEKYSWNERHMDPEFGDELDHFKRSADGGRNERTRRRDRSPIRDRIAADGSSRGPPAHDRRSNRDYRRHYRGSDSVASCSYGRPHGNSYSGNRNSGHTSRHNPNDRSRQSRERYRKSERDVTSGSPEMSYYDDRNSYRYHNRKNHGYRHARTSSADRSERSYHIQQSSGVNKNYTAKYISAQRDLRDVLYEKRNKAVQLGLRDMTSDKKTNTFKRGHESIKVHEPNSRDHHGDDSRRSEIYDEQNGSSFSDKQSQDNNSSAEHQINTNTDDIDVKYDQSLIQYKSHNIILEHDEHSDGFNNLGKYSHDISHVQYPNIASNRLQQNTGSSFKCKREGYDKKEYRNSDDVDM